MTQANVLGGPAAFHRPPFDPFAFVRRLRWRYFPPKSGMERWAEREVARLLGDPEGDEMQAAMNKHLLKMVRAFGREGHSGFSASYAVGCLEKLLRYEPLTPLTGEDSEWNDISDMSDEPQWQNNRCSHVFKDADGRAYDIDGKVFVEPSGAAFTGNGSRVFIEFPYTPAREYVQVDDDGKPLDGSPR